MKKRRISPRWTVTDDNIVINTLGEEIGIAYTDKNGKLFYLKKREGPPPKEKTAKDVINHWKGKMLRK